MAKRKRDISISMGKLKELAEKIKSKFYAETHTTEQFTGSVKSPIYKNLKEHIRSIVRGKPSISESTLRNIILHNHNGRFQLSTYITLKEYVSNISYGEPLQQQIFWGVNYHTDPGAYINRIDGEFISWNQLKEELELRVICRCPRIIPVDSQVRLEDFYGRKNWSVWIINNEGEHIASVWIGVDPEKNWRSDGLIRVGKTISDTKWIVYQILARYSDGSYRMVESRV